MTATTDTHTTESSRGIFRRVIDWLNAPVLPESDAERPLAQSADDIEPAPAAAGVEPEPITERPTAATPPARPVAQAAAEQAAAQQAGAIAELVAQHRVVRAELLATRRLLARHEATLCPPPADLSTATDGKNGFTSSDPRLDPSLPASLADALPSWPDAEMHYGQVHDAMFREPAPTADTVVMVEIDLHHIDQAIVHSRRDLPQSGVMRYAPFLLRAMCIADAGDDPNEAPLHVHVTGPDGQSQVLTDAQDQRLPALSRRLILDGSASTTDTDTTGIDATLALQLVESASGRLGLTINQSANPLVALAHLGARPHLGNDENGNATIALHPIALLSVQVPASSPTEAGEWLSHLRDLLEQRDWAAELD